MLIGDSPAFRQAIARARRVAPTDAALTPAMAVPGWNSGNPYRAGWDGTRPLRGAVGARAEGVR